MSTKIYHGVRAPAERIVDFIDHFHEAMMKEAEMFVEELMHVIEPEKVGEVPDYIKGDVEGEQLWERSKRFSVLEEEIRKAAKSPYRDSFDVSCGFNLWVYRYRNTIPYVYAIPIGPNWALDTMAPKNLPDWVEDFSFWDNTDEPKGMSGAEWKRRATRWNAICTGTGKASHNPRRLYHEVIDAKDGMGLFDFRWRLVGEAFAKWQEEHRKKQP